MNFMQKTALSMLISASATTAYAQAPASPERLDEVAERGAHVMPFALEKTRHVFDKTKHGGIQQVVAKDAADSEQIALIRRHLSDIADGFKRGDFSKQRRIHGDDMPGVNDLAASYRNIRFDYRELPNGAEIEFVAEEPALVDAIHRYFNAQFRDHARHAVAGGHSMHHGHQP